MDASSWGKNSPLEPSEIAQLEARIPRIEIQTLMHGPLNFANNFNYLEFNRQSRLAL